MEYNDNYILYVENLSKSYPGFQLDVSLVLPKGCIMGLVGANGAGKSTTLRLLLGLAHPDGGRSVVLGSEDLNRTPALREEIGVVFDECSFPEVLTAAQLGKVLARVHPHWEDGEYQRLLDRLELPRGKAIKEFSRGMKMKLAIAAALSHSPRLLLLDEPTSGLDPVVRGQVLDLFQDFIQDEERGILLSSHITSDLERIADYITFMDHGRVLLTEEKDTLVEVYGIIKGPAARMGEIAPGDALGLTATGHGFEGLVRDKEAMARKYPEFILDRANLDEIILFLTREEAKGGK
jgi:ABC-2 type transport system ATP-binding protein